MTETDFSRPTRRGVLMAGAGAFAAGLVGAPAIVRAQTTSVPFSLDFRIYGGNSPFFLGQQDGIFKDLGVDMKLDGSAGSGESVRRVASGTHSMGFADVSTLVEFAARNPDATPKLIMTVFDRFPAVILSLKKKPINSLKEMEGARIGIGTSDAGAKILPALLNLNNIDRAKIDFVTIDVKLRDTLILKGEVDGVVAFDYTSMFNLMGNGVPLEDINVIYYSDYGFSFPANSLIASQAMIRDNPDLVRNVALGVARSWKAGIADPQKSTDAVMKREPLLRPDVELARLKWVIEKHVLTENVKANGLGFVDPARMTKGIEVIREGFELDKAPELGQYYDDSFLPAREELKMV